MLCAGRRRFALPATVSAEVLVFYSINKWNKEAPGKEEVYEAFAETTKALANGRRLELVELLAQGAHSVEQLASFTSMAMTSTSAHLQKLAVAGLVRRRREGTTVFYSLSGDDVAELYTATKRVALNRSQRLREQLSEYMEQAPAKGPVIDPAAVTADMLIIDVRPAQEFAAGHFPGARSFPLDELETRIPEIPVDADIVVYCRGELCRLAREAAVLLRRRGFEARAMDEGIVEWRAGKGVDLDAA